MLDFVAEFRIPEKGNISRIREQLLATTGAMPTPLDKHFAAFLRHARGEQTYAQLSRKTGVPISTLHRIELGEQSITLRMLHQIMVRLKCGLSDIFPVSIIERRTFRDIPSPKRPTPRSG